MSGYVVTGTAEDFTRSQTAWDSAVASLKTPAACELTHADLEEQLTETARTVMLALFQDHLDLRTIREERRSDVVGADKVARTRVETGHRRVLTTVFGQVETVRIAYRAPGVDNLYPADAVLSLPAGKHSHGLRRLAAIESGRGSFAQASAAINRTTGVTVGKRQIQELATAAATDIQAFYLASRPGPSPADVLLGMQFDGKGVVMLAKALREATATAARAATTKLSTRLSPGEKNGRKRMAELAAVYDCPPAPRTPADIITRPAMTTTSPGQGPHQPPAKASDPPERRPRPTTTGKWLTASITNDIPSVITAGFDEADRRDPDHTRTWVALVDGNRTQIQAIHTEADRRGVTVNIVIDFIHVLEYVWKAAWSFYDKGDPDAETWVATQAHKILEGKAGTVAAGIRRHATTYGFSTTERHGADTCANYLTAKKPYLDYATALSKGWPIATGIIEGACRHIVKDRMDITGARWGLTSAESILTLRAMTSNGDFDAYWKWHLTQEHQRVHHTQYRDQHALAA